MKKHFLLNGRITVPVRRKKSQLTNENRKRNARSK